MARYAGTFAASVASVVALCSHASADEPYFIGLGRLSGGSWSTAMAVSADGTTVVGDAENADGNREASRWTSDGGMMGLGFLPNSSPYPISRAIEDSGVSRLRPVAMAALTTALGLIPLLLDAFFIAMAVTIIAGLLFATVLTMIVVPVLYATLYRVRSE